MLQIKAAFTLFAREQIARAAFIGPDLLQVPRRKRFRRGAHLIVAVAPQRVDIIVFRKHF